MPFVEPLSTIKTAPRTLGEIERDKGLVHDLSNLVPEADTRSALAESYANAPTLEAALGDPKEVAAHLSELLGHAAGGAEAKRLDAELGRLLAGDTQSSTIEVRADDVATARLEIARHWMDLVIEAPRYGSKTKSFPIDAALLLPNVDGKDWIDLLVGAEDALLATLSLDRDNYLRVQRAFATKLRDALAEHPILLPDGLEVRLDGGKMSVSEREPVFPLQEKSSPPPAAEKISTRAYAMSGRRSRSSFVWKVAQTGAVAFAAAAITFVGMNYKTDRITPPAQLAAFQTVNFDPVIPSASALVLPQILVHDDNVLVTDTPLDAGTTQQQVNLVLKSKKPDQARFAESCDTIVKDPKRPDSVRVRIACTAGLCSAAPAASAKQPFCITSFIASTGASDDLVF